MILDTSRDETAKLLGAVKELLTTVELLGEAVTRLKEKRATLEEKMIRQYLHDLAAVIALSISDFHRKLASEAYDIDDEAVTRLVELAGDAQLVFAELVKVIGYDWNYLEQYYEYDFYARLKNEHRFAQRLEDLSKTIFTEKPIPVSD